MKKYSKIMAMVSLAGCLLLPGLVQAKPHHGNSNGCQLDSQEFVYFQLDLSQNLNNLQLDLVSTNIRDSEVVAAMDALVKANANLYSDTGRYASQHNKFQYSKDKLLALKDAAYNYYSIVYYKYRNMQSHVLNAYKMAKAADYAIEQFDAQCSRPGHRPNSWMDGWNNIYNYNANAMVAPQPRPSANNNNNNNQVDDGNVVYHPVVNPQPNPAPAPQPQMPRPGNPAPGMMYPGNPAPGMMYPGNPEPGMMYPGNPDPGMMYPGNPGFHGHGHAAMPMRDSDFNAFHNSVEQARFDSSRLPVIRSVIESGNLLTCDQIISILKLMTYESERKNAAEIMYKGVYDKNNWFKVYDVFKFSSDRTDLEKRIQAIEAASPSPSPNAHRGPAMPMRDADFNSFYNSVEKASFDSDKKAVIRTVINSGNLLTCDQIVRILNLFRFDSDRVDVAADLYQVAYDKNNWFKVYDVFRFDSDRKKLEQKIR